MRDLWPEDIGPISEKAPVNILREQASFLGQKTNNLIEAEVRQHEVSPSRDKEFIKEFIYDFLIVVPPLDNYRYKLFRISHKISLYPVKINVDEDILPDINPTYEREDTFEPAILAKSEDDFLAILKEIFNSTKTRRVIGALLSMISTDTPNSDKVVYG
jgi:hypothetical protein